jgi:peptide/nickel transport system permease protein
MTVGVTIGVIAGYYRGIADTLLSRISDVVLAMPALLLAIGIGAACGQTAQGCVNGLIQPGLGLVVFVISAFTWPYVARIVRSTTLSLREREFVEAARSLGASDARIIFREILPNLVAPITIWATLLIPSNILFEAALSFLGLGVPVTTASWGSALSDAAAGGLYKDAPWMMIFPGIFLVLTTLAFNLLGDGLRDALDPRSER